MDKNMKHITSLEGFLFESNSDWKEIKGELIRDYKFKTYNDSIKFVNAVFKIAQKQNHHPQINIGYNKVTLSISDHEQGGISAKCHKFVHAVNKIEN